MIRHLLLLLTATAAGAANLVPNSSFENGLTNWFPTGATNIIQTGGWHGTFCCRIPRDNQIRSGPLDLKTGPHMLSFVLRAVTQPVGPIYAWVIGNPLESPYPHVAGNATEEYVRLTVPINIVTNGQYFVSIGHFQPDVVIDGVQLETGTVATAYSPFEVPVVPSVLAVWDANPETIVEGYNLQGGPKSRTNSPYTWTVTLMGRLNTNGYVAVSALSAGVNYFGVQAFGDGVISPYSNEVTWTNGLKAPTRLSVTPVP